MPEPRHASQFHRVRSGTLYSAAKTKPPTRFRYKHNLRYPHRKLRNFTRRSFVRSICTSWNILSGRAIRGNYCFGCLQNSVVVQNGKKVLGYAYNPPYSFGCAPGDAKHRCFREWAEIATVSGLSVEQQSSTEKKQVFYRLCFDTFLAQQGQSAMQQVTPARMQQLIGKYIDRGLALSPQCGDPWEKVPEDRGADTLNFTVGPNLFKIVPRSAYAIFQLLGKILKDQENHDNDAPLPPGISAEDAAPILTTVLGDQNLVTIVKDANGDCFTETQFVDGHYCVPESAANTKRIFGLLAQLIALQTSATDIAITPTVHTVQ